jgi:hypothetical protein
MSDLAGHEEPLHEGEDPARAVDARDGLVASSSVSSAEAMGALRAMAAGVGVQRSGGRRTGSQPAVAAAVLALQRTAGNASVGRMLQRQPRPATADPASASGATGESDPDPGGARRALELDQAREIVISTFYGAPESTSTPILLDQAKRLAADFALEDAPRTRVAAARALIAIAQVLHEREEAADVDERTWALLLPGEWGEPPKPWTPERPMSLDEIPPFGTEAEVAWTAAVLAEAATAGPVRRRRRGPPTPPPSVRDDVPDVEDVEPGAPSVASTATFSKPTAVERAAGAEVGGDAEIRSGLAALRSVTDSQAAGAVQARLGSKSGASAGAVTGSGRALLDSVGEIWFVERRLYAIDRTGHATAADWDDFAFDLQSISLDSGTYYYGPFAIGSSGFQANNLVKVDGTVATGRGDIYPARVLTSLIPLLERGRGHLRSSHGIAIIVSSHIREETPSFDSDRLLQAVERAKGHAGWALSVKIAEMREHPEEEVAKLALGLAVSRLTAAIPVVGQAMLAYQLLRLAEWMGEAADVAGRARSVDELDVAAQAIARKTVNWAVTEAITRVASGATRAAAGAVRGGRGGGSGGSGGPRGPAGGGGPMRNRYPGFAPPAASESALVADQAGRLQAASGLRIRTDQILEAPWIGRNTPRSTSEGWLRDSGRFWTAYSRHAPNEFALLNGGHVVTPAYADAMGWPRSSVGQTLVHHHINNSRFVLPFPANAHGPGVHRQATVEARP